MAQSDSGPTELVSSHTTLSVETREVDGHTVAMFTAGANGDDGSPASGAMTLVEHGRSIAGAALNREGKAQITVSGLTAGDHTVRAVYAGDSLHAGSRSESLTVHPMAASTDFAFTVSNASPVIAAPGDNVTLTATVTPSTGFTGFISLSCAGTGTTAVLPVGVTCTFAPANLEILAPTTANPAGAQSADLSIVTTAPAGGSARNQGPAAVGDRIARPLVLSLLLPGILGLGFLARKRKLLGPIVLLIAVGALSVLGVTGCSARYGYFHHPPTYNPGTTPGTYNLIVTAQTSNGVSASSQAVPIVLTVK